jgi:serine/threonine-protein kinase RsbW
MNGNTMAAPATVTLTIPALPEFVGVARLAVLGVASRMKFSYDEVEDLRLAVGEACTGAIERAARAASAGSVRINCLMDEDALTVEVHDNAPLVEAQPEAGGTFEPESISALLMEILVDGVSVTQDPDGGTVVTLVKKSDQ